MAKRMHVLATLSALLGAPAAAQVGTVDSEVKISETAGGFGGVLDSVDQFGLTITTLGDLDGDGVTDLAVGANRDDDGGTDQGAVWILFLEADGTVKSEQKISELFGSFAGPLDAGDFFGQSVAFLGDLDGNGTRELAVGAVLDDDGGTDQGAVWILSLAADGTVAASHKISETAGGFTGVLDPFDEFGIAVESLPDLDGDGIRELAVGARKDDDGGTDQGALWILFLDAAGLVKSQTKISETSGGFTGVLDSIDFFGTSVTSLGDLNGDGNLDLAVGADFDDDGGVDHGSVWILFLDTDETVLSEQKISATAGGFGGALDNDRFGRSVSSRGDIDGDGIRDLAVGAFEDDDGGTGQGALWILFLNADGTVKSEQKISELFGGFGGVLDTGDQFGQPPFFIGDFDGDGIDELAVGAPADDDGGSNQGAVWILFLEGDLGPPTISCPPVVTAIDPFKGPTGEVVFFSVPATDDSDPAPSVVCVPPSGSLFPPGTTIVTCTATDAAGNQATCQFPVVVVPMLRPGQL